MAQSQTRGPLLNPFDAEYIFLCSLWFQREPIATGNILICFRGTYTRKWRFVSVFLEGGPFEVNHTPRLPFKRCPSDIKAGSLFPWTPLVWKYVCRSVGSRGDLSLLDICYCSRGGLGTELCE